MWPLECYSLRRMTDTDEFFRGNITCYPVGYTGVSDAGPVQKNGISVPRPKSNGQSHVKKTWETFFKPKLRFLEKKRYLPMGVRTDLVARGLVNPHKITTLEADHRPNETNAPEQCDKAMRNKALSANKSDSLKRINTTVEKEIDRINIISIIIIIIITIISTISIIIISSIIIVSSIIVISIIINIIIISSSIISIIIISIFISSSSSIIIIIIIGLIALDLLTDHDVPAESQVERILDDGRRKTNAGSANVLERSGVGRLRRLHGFLKQSARSTAAPDDAVWTGTGYNADADGDRSGYTHSGYGSAVTGATGVNALDFLEQSDPAEETRVPCLDTGLSPCVKEELKYVIQSKRLKEGKGELKVEFTEPQSYQLTPEEEEKVDKRKVQNRMAARRFRDRQKNQTSSLQKECQRLERAHTELRAELAQVRKERDEMRQALETHMSACPLQFPACFHIGLSGCNGSS